MDIVRFSIMVGLMCIASPLLALPPAPQGPYESLEDYRAWRMNGQPDSETVNATNRGQPGPMEDMPFQSMAPVQSMPVWNWGAASYPDSQFVQPAPLIDQSNK